MAADITTKDRLKGEVMLLMAALIWGSAYLFQKEGMDYVGPFTFGFFRFCLGALVLIPVIAVSDRYKKRKIIAKGGAYTASQSSRQLLIGGIIIGVANFVAATFQQVGLIYTTTGKAGFITAMDIIFVPIVLLLFFRKKVRPVTWAAVLIAGLGLYLLCISGDFSLQLGDSLVMLCALFYAFQIVFIDRYVDLVDPLRLAFLEFAFSAVLSGIMMLIFENPDPAGIIECTIPLLYTGILEVGCAFTLEILGQKYVAPSIAAIIMSFESVFAVLCGMIFVGESMSGRETAGCAVMFFAILLSQLADEKK